MRMRVRLSLSALALAVALAPTVVANKPAQALFAGGGVIQRQGFDICFAPSTSDMWAWWVNTPWWWIGIYIGGSLRACPQVNLSPGWLDTTYGQGWRFEPIWVGPQAPCTNYRDRISTDIQTAYSQGKSEALSAWGALRNLGFGNGDGTPVVYDMEAFSDFVTEPCKAAVRAFLQGWIDQLKIPPAQVAGVYGSGCASFLDDLAGLGPPPDFIWGADWSGVASTGQIACVNAGSWVFSQRLKQYRGPHNETWGGVTLNIDTDCANGTVAPAGGSGTDPWCL